MPADYNRPPMQIRADSALTIVSSASGLPDIGASVGMYSGEIGNPDLFASMSSMAFDDDTLLAFDDDEEKDIIGDLSRNGKICSKSGKPISSTAEKKATHNAVERARRESLNGRFLVLADMLPGMNHVKRASKAAIVNKSIDFIREMQLVEHKLTKENESLKAELAALKSGNKAAKKGTAASADTSPANKPAPLASPFPKSIPALATPPMPASQYAQQPAPISLPSMDMHQLQQQQQPISPVAGLFTGNPMMHSFVPSPQTVAGMFSHMMGPPQQQQNSMQQRSDSASPASQIASLPVPPSTASSVQAQQQFNASAFNPANYFELAGLGAGPIGASPTAFNGAMLFQPGNSPSGEKSSTMTTAPSPTSSYSVQTPANNAYSPISLPNLGIDLGSSSSSSHDGSSPRTSSGTNATSNADSPPASHALMPAGMDAAAFNKAQAELQGFMAYQQRMAAANAAAAAMSMNMQGNAFAAAAAAAAGMYGPSQQADASPQSSGPQNPFLGVPAWQLMLAQQAAQQAAMNAYGSSGSF